MDNLMAQPSGSGDTRDNTERRYLREPRAWASNSFRLSEFFGFFESSCKTEVMIADAAYDVAATSPAQNGSISEMQRN